MAPAHESETIVFNFRKLLSTLPNYAELEQILLFSVNWGKQVCYWLELIKDEKIAMIQRPYELLSSCSIVTQFSLFTFGNHWTN